MALYTISSGSVALSANSTKTMVLTNPVTNEMRVVEIGVSFDNSAAASSASIDLCKATTLGSPFGTLATVVKNNANIQNATTTGSTALTVEPTTYEIYKSWYMSESNGTFVIQFPLGREYLGTAAGNRIAIRVSTGNAATNAKAYIEWEE